MRFPKHVRGDLCEAIALKELISRGYWVFKSDLTHSPIDIIAVAPGGNVLMLDVKQEARRVLKDRKHLGPCRIHRVLSEQQKKLGVRMCYVNLDTEEICIIPRDGWSGPS